MYPTFIDDIKKMNSTYDLSVAPKPELINNSRHLTNERLKNFLKTINAEISEIDDIFHLILDDKSDSDQILIALSDWFADLIVYISSESIKFGIPLSEVLQIVMESNFTKLSAEDKPIKNAEGKFEKGPNFRPPEPEIKLLLQDKIKEYNNALLFIQS